MIFYHHTCIMHLSCLKDLPGRTRALVGDFLPQLLTFCEGEDGVVDNLDGWSHGEMEYPLIHKKYPYAFARNPNAWDDRGNELAFCILTDDYNAAKRCLDGWRRKLPTEQQQSKLWEFFLGSSGNYRTSFFC